MFGAGESWHHYSRGAGATARLIAPDDRADDSESGRHCNCGTGTGRSHYSSVVDRKVANMLGMPSLGLLLTGGSLDIDTEDT